MVFKHTAVGEYILFGSLVGSDYYCMYFYAILCITTSSVLPGTWYVLLSRPVIPIGFLSTTEAYALYLPGICK